MGLELTLTESLLRLGLVAVLAGAIGVERELRDQDAGLRTHLLVGVGAALFVMAGNFTWSEVRFGNDVGIVLDPSRVVAYVVTGVGFLGAGAIIKHGSGVRGLTTAASLWVVAAIGVVVAAGDYALGVLATAAVILSLWPLKKLVSVLGLRSDHTRRLVVELEQGAKVSELMRSVETSEAEIVSTRMVSSADTRKLTVDLVGREPVLLELLDDVARSPAVRQVSLAT